MICVKIWVMNKEIVAMNTITIDQTLRINVEAESNVVIALRCWLQLHVCTLRYSNNSTCTLTSVTNSNVDASLTVKIPTHSPPIIAYYLAVILETLHAYTKGMEGQHAQHKQW